MVWRFYEFIFVGLSNLVKYLENSTRTVRSILSSERRLWHPGGRIRTVRKLQTGVGPMKGQSTTNSAHRPSAAVAVNWQTRDHLFILLI